MRHQWPESDRKQTRKIRTRSTAPGVIARFRALTREPASTGSHVADRATELLRSLSVVFILGEMCLLNFLIGSYPNCILPELENYKLIRKN